MMCWFESLLCLERDYRTGECQVCSYYYYYDLLKTNSRRLSQVLMESILYQRLDI
jgi:hypothetical protein